MTEKTETTDYQNVLTRNVSTHPASTYRITIDALKEHIDGLISNHESFTVIGLGGEMLDCTEYLEKQIERKSLSCRVYTKGRLAAAGGGALLGGAGLLGLIGIAAHNIATLNPDYEIARNPIDHEIEVTYVG